MNRSEDSPSVSDAAASFSSSAAARADWAAWARSLWTPLRDHYSPGGARLRLGPCVATYSQSGSELEAWARQFWYLAPLAAAATTGMASSIRWTITIPGRCTSTPLLYAVWREQEDPERARRFRERALCFAERHVRWFAVDGVAVPYGRSMIYRLGQASFWSALAWSGAGGDAFPPEVCKGLLLRNLRDWRRRSVFGRPGQPPALPATRRGLAARPDHTPLRGGRRRHPHRMVAADRGRAGDHPYRPARRGTPACPRN